MSPLVFAWRSLSRQPARAVLGVAGIAAVGALLFDMLLLSRGLVISFRDILGSAGFDVRVTASAALPMMGPSLGAVEETTRLLRALPEIREVVPQRVGEAEVELADGSTAQLTFLGSGPREGPGWTVLTGEGLTERGGDLAVPAIVNQELAAKLSLKPGSTLRLRGACSRAASALPAVDVRVRGIVAFPFEGLGELTLMTTLPGFLRVCADQPADMAELLLVASSPEAGADAAAAAIRRARPGLHAYSNEQLLDRLQQTDLSYFRQISFVLSSITLFFAFLLVATLLTVSVNQRLGELATLRALGVRRRRIIAHLFCESALLVGAGSLLALPIGAVFAHQLDGILRTMPGLPEALHFFVFEPRLVLVHLALLCSTGILGALYPAYLAARLPIAATLRKEVVS